MPQRNGGLGTALREAEAQCCPGNGTRSGLNCTETLTSTSHAYVAVTPQPQRCSCQPSACPDPLEPAEQLLQCQTRLRLGTTAASHPQPSAQGWL